MINDHTKDRSPLAHSSRSDSSLTPKSSPSVSRVSVAYPHEAYELADALYKIGLFTLTQGAYKDQSALALTYVSRFYQALSLWPIELTERLSQQARQLVPSERVQLGLSIAHQLKPFLGPSINESALSEFFRSISAALGTHGEHLSTLLTAFNDEVLSPLKTRLNPRKLIEVEERLGSILYQAILQVKPRSSSHFLPEEYWPQLKSYILIQSLPPQGETFSFLALRSSDQARCIVYMSDTYIALHPHVEDEEWPVHCVKPLEYGRFEFKND
jgi:hypothetical protein